MTELERLRRDLSQIGDLMMATMGVVEDLVRITHRNHPEELEEILRKQRILVQEATTDRTLLENDTTLASHRMQLRILERALGRDGAPPTSAQA